MVAPRGGDMSSWVPEELPPDSELALAEPPATTSPELGSPGGRAPLGAPQFAPYQASPFAPPPPRATPTRRRVWIGAGLGVVVVLLVVGGGIGLAGGFSPRLNVEYSGAPVEASDASDGATIVGLDDTIAYVPDAEWPNYTRYLEVEGVTGPAAVADDVVGVHSFKGSDGFTEIVVVLGHRTSPLDDPTARFAAILAEVYQIDVGELSGPVRPVDTALGLDGAVGLLDRPLAQVLDQPPPEERLYTRFAILGRGSNAAIVEWIRFGAPADEAAFQRLIDTVRVDA